MSAKIANTFYYIWLWYNSTNGLTATLDISSTTPTYPTGYVSTDYKARMPGAVKTDGSGSKYLLQVRTAGNLTTYVVALSGNVLSLPSLASGSSIGSVTIPTWVAVSVSAYVPTNVASSILVNLTSANNGQAIAAPNAAYGANGSTTNPPFLGTSGYGLSSVMGEMLLESTNIYWAVINSVATISCYGWRDNI